MVTISDVAKAAGVSISTVSYALSGKRTIAASTRARVESAIRELDYEPSRRGPHARGRDDEHPRPVGAHP